MSQLTLNLKILMDRIYHTWDKWECYRSGFFEVNPPKGLDDTDCVNIYTSMLRDQEQFRSITKKIIREWKFSCEHNLTNERMNRIAWMGQAALAYQYKIPAKYRGGYHDLTKDEQVIADNIALEAINEWLELNSYSERHTLQSIESKTEVDLY